MITGFLASLLSSCTNEALLENNVWGKELIVSAEIALAETENKTRAADSYDKTAFNEDEQIKISKSGGGEALYKKSGTHWLPVAGQTPLTVTNSSEIFTAIYPTGFNAIVSDQTNSDNFSKSNKLMAEASTTASGNSVNFKFAPAFCKMTVTVAFQDERSNVTATLTGNNVCTETGKTGSVQLLRTSSNVASKQHSFICIFNPGTYVYSLTVKSTLTGGQEKTDTYTGASTVFAKSNNYIYNFTSTNELILTGLKVISFTDGGTQDAGSAT